MNRGWRRALTLKDKLFIVTALRRQPETRNAQIGTLAFVADEKIRRAIMLYWSPLTPMEVLETNRLLLLLHNVCTHCGKQMDNIRFAVAQGMICHRCRRKKRWKGIKIIKLNQPKRKKDDA